jgi:hypothetical protein
MIDMPKLRITAIIFTVLLAPLIGISAVAIATPKINQNYVFALLTAFYIAFLIVSTAGIAVLTLILV